VSVSVGIRRFVAISLGLAISLLLAPALQPVAAAAEGPDRVAGAPDAPRDLSVAAAPDVPTSGWISPLTGPAESSLYSLRATWTVPASQGGSPLTGYTVIVSRPAGGPIRQDVPLAKCSGMLCAADVAAVSAAGDYTVAVFAVNAVGNGAEAMVVATTGVPSVPRDVSGVVLAEMATGWVTPVTGSAESGLFMLRVTWTPPASINGTPLSGYTVTVSRPVGAPIQRSVPVSACSATACAFNVPAVSSSGVYTASIYAINAAGNGRAAEVNVASGVPNAPRDLAGVALPTMAPGWLYPVTGPAESGWYLLRTSWSVPTPSNSTPITGYTVMVSRPKGAPVRQDVPLSKCSLTSCTTDIPALSFAGDYLITVFAINAAGNSPDATSVVAIGAPSEPRDVTAVASPDVSSSASLTPMVGLTESGTFFKVRVSWTVPLASNGAPISGYTAVVSRPVGGPVKADVPLSKCTATSCTTDIAALSIPGEYSVVVFATNAAGNSAEASGALVVPSNSTTGVQRPPTVTAVTASLSSTVSAQGLYWVTVGWDIPVPSAGSLPVSGYTVLVRRPTGTPWALTSSTCTPATGRCTWAGYTVSAPGVYSFSVLATGPSGNGPESQLAVIHNNPPELPAGVTEAATGATTSGGVGQVRVAWERPPVPAGTPIGGYIVTVIRPGSAPSTWWAPATACDTAGACSSLGWALDSTGSYYATVEAANSAGNSVAGSSPLTSFTVNANGSGSTLTPPSPPQNAQITLANGNLTLSWDAAASRGGATAVNYLVEFEGPVGTPTMTSMPDTARAYTVAGLTWPGPYKATVWANNAAGNSAPATPAPVTLSTPMAITGVTGNITGGNLALQWDAMPTARNGGAAVTGYTILITPPQGSPTVLTRAATATNATYATAIQGVYRYEVLATNSAGNGDPTAGSAALLTPSMPTALQATISGGEFVATWRAPATDGGSPVTGYVALFLKSNQPIASRSGAQVTSTIDPASGQLAYRAAVPADGIDGTYRVDVTAASQAGNSPPATASISADVPSVPQAVTADISNRTVVVHWSPPASDHGIPVSNYYITVERPRSTPLFYSVVADPNAIRLTAPSFDAADSGSYSVTVQAASAAGSGPISAPVTVATGTPAAPQALHGSRTGNGTLSITWETPLTDGNSAVTGYTAFLFPQVGAMQVQSVPVAGNSSVIATPNDHGTTTYSWTPMATGAGEYRVEVAAKNTAGNGSIGHTSVVVTGPSKVRGIGVSYANGVLTATWSNPADNGGAAITGYLVTWNRPVGAPISHLATSSTDGLSTTQPGTYTVHVTGRNSAGNGPGTGRNIAVNADGTFSVGSALTSMWVEAGPLPVGMSIPVVFHFDSVGDGQVEAQQVVITMPDGLTVTEVADTPSVGCKAAADQLSVRCFLNGTGTAADSTTATLRIHAASSVTAIQALPITASPSTIIGHISITRPDTFMAPYNAVPALLDSAQLCADVIVIGARGSSEGVGANGLGARDEALVDHLHNLPGSFTTMSTIGVFFLAPAVPPDTPVNEYLQAGDTGVQDSRARLDNVIQACPTSKLVLVGYSLGAWIMQTVATTLSPEQWAHVAGVALLSSPGLSPTDGISTRFGALAPDDHAPTPATYGVGEFATRALEGLRVVAGGNATTWLAPSIVNPEAVITFSAANALVADIESWNVDILERHAWVTPSAQNRVVHICDNNDAVCSFDDLTNSISAIPDDLTTAGSILVGGPASALLARLVTSQMSDVHTGAAYTDGLSADVVTEFMSAVGIR